MLAKPATTIRTQGRGVDTLQHEVLLLIDHISLRAGIASPEHIHQMLTMGGQGLNSGIGKLLPSQRRVTVSLMRPDRQRGIQKQHPLFSPARQIAGSGDGCPKVGLYLLEDVLQGRGKLDAVLHREAQPVGLTRFVIRILSDDHHLHLVERTQVEGIEYQLTRRIAGGLHILLSHRFSQL